MPTILNYFRLAALTGVELPGDSAVRAPLLERVLARADRLPDSTDWRTDAWRCLASPEAAMPSVAATAYAALGFEEAGWVSVATPVNYLAEMSNVRLAVDGVLTLQPDEARQLALDFNRIWHDAGVKLSAGPSGELFCLSTTAWDALTCDPDELRNRHIEDFLPRGPAAALLRRLMSEMEMWLFDHAVNHERAAQANVPVSALWLWGGGAARPMRAAGPASPPLAGWTAGDDVFLRAFAPRTEYPDSAQAAASAGGAVLLRELPGTEAWAAAETRWLAPALAALRAGRVNRLHVSMGIKRFAVTARGMRRWWRRARPWWEYLR